MNEILSSTTMSDQEKFLAMKLIQRSSLKLVCTSVCDRVQQPDGVGTTAYFIRYERMNVPQNPATEGVTPANSSFSLTLVTATMAQWIDVITITDQAQVTTKHPLVQQCLELLADNAQRVIDREIQIVWLAGTNVQYGDGSVSARASITSTMKITDTIIHKARITLIDQGAPPRGGPAGGIILGEGGNALAGSEMRQGVETAGKGGGSINQGQAYVAIVGPQVSGDVQAASASFGTWASVATYANQKAVYNSEVGTWLNIRWVETNFIPKFTLLGNTTTAVTTANAFGTGTPVVTAVNGGGALTSSTSFYFKVSRRAKLRGFEEDISIPHTMTSSATGNNESFTFDFTGLSSLYTYRVYFDTVTTGGTGTDATLGLAYDNIEAGDIVTVTSNPSTATTAPANIHGTGSSDPSTIHPVYLHGNESCNFVGLRNLELHVTGNTPTDSDPAMQRKKMAYKVWFAAMIRDQLRMLRLELASNY